ncbi:DUF1579 family protein [Nocardia sp. NPDC048505]|uniref:DUF1579 family protein n=1 Tax=unclassified Nocardia TaxID=2637762 RepID=UPI0033CE6316
MVQFRKLLPAVLVTLALAGTACGADTVAAPASTSTAVPAHQFPGHARLDQLVGEWNAEKQTFVAGGTPEQPLVARGAVSRWRWITETGNNFLREEVEGELSDRPYYRLGLLGYSPTDDRYEWSTVDSVTPMMMVYRGAKASGAASEITMTGEFTDPGIAGHPGATIPMRTVIKLESVDRTVMEISFTPPGEAERLIDRVVLTRRK